MYADKNILNNTTTVHKYPGYIVGEDVLCHMFYALSDLLTVWKSVQVFTTFYIIM